MGLNSKSLAGPGYIILNVLRGMNIIALLSVVTASVVMLIKTFVVSKFFFFDAVTHVLRASVCLFLIVSEIGLFRPYFARNWPLLSPKHGFVFLACLMMAIGVNILGNLNKEATSQESIGLAFWRIVIGSGIVVLVIGVFNLVASYLFRDRGLKVSARRIRSHGAVALSNAEAERAHLETAMMSPHPSSKNLNIATSFTGCDSSIKSYKSPTQKSPSPKRATFKNFSAAKTFRAARASILPSYHSRVERAAIDAAEAKSPSYHPREPISPASSRYSRTTSGRDAHGRERERDMEISMPLNVNPQFAHLLKPDLAHHPSQRRGETTSPGGWV
ncbi:hypothetical protein P152DRAFT_80316 [Eremomyces bilateralis CBS 781.70]|uniref:DUF7598 domain-containing protein n=1 Tax=Eremomyces bilateralis CBS 781.70 TaxID=1392243 RepID=A0A6G1FZJ5_9PEZI|nr:uncharacterized protein P152DRAFT_80316 [Eremomyces bilateralis CBS 781.70]KAF1811142.1 hypothetical protein P152DRAFT_80316 [Eremomyces bilateralis CBS 781.70]